MAEKSKSGTVRIFGIDPGLRRTGWGVVEVEGNRLRWVADGVIRPDPRIPDTDRLHDIFSELTAILGGHGPDLGAVEEVFISRNPASALKLGMARGAAMLALAVHGVPVEEISARRVKQNVTGSGRADKAQVTAMVSRLLGIAPEAEDSADALAVAIAAINEGTGGVPVADPVPATSGLDAAIARALEREGGRAG